MKKLFKLLSVLTLLSSSTIFANPKIQCGYNHFTYVFGVDDLEYGQYGEVTNQDWFIDTGVEYFGDYVLNTPIGVHTATAGQVSVEVVFKGEFTDWYTSRHMNARIFGIELYDETDSLWESQSVYASNLGRVKVLAETNDKWYVYVKAENYKTFATRSFRFDTTLTNLRVSLTELAPELELRVKEIRVKLVDVPFPDECR